jgi:hypothetical protein
MDNATTNMHVHKHAASQKRALQSGIVAEDNASATDSLASLSLYQRQQ